MQIKDFRQFESFIKSRIPSREALFMGDIGLRRAKYFMKLLGNPQNKIKVIHIAGTSGKGSTCHLISHILCSQGFNVGMSISPHVFDIRERMQINNKLPEKKLILKYFNEILPAILKMEKCKYGMPTFFEINIALAYYMFFKEKLDYAVIETGLGGMLDATNTVTNKNKICILTKIGLDHTEILGKTISKIAEQKAAITQKQNTTISIQQTENAMKVIKNQCKRQKAELYFINKKNYKIIYSTPSETVFDFKISNTNTNKSEFDSESESNSEKNVMSLRNINLGLVGQHQAQNCSLALACLEILSKREKFSIDEKKLRNALRNITIPGRCEIIKRNNNTIIIDGAHNPQKMNVFIGNLAKIFPNQKFIFIVSFKKGKDFKSMLKYIIPFADKILLTHFSTKKQDNHLSSIDNEEIAKYLNSQNFRNFKIINNTSADIIKNIKASKKPIIITGSLYLIGQIYKYFEK